MSSIINATTSGGLVISPDSSGQLQLQSNGVNTLLMSSNGISGFIYSANNGVAQSPVGTTVCDFTGIPSWVKKITIIVSGAGMSTGSYIQIQVGDSTSFKNTGYLNYTSYAGSSGGSTSSTTGIVIESGTPASTGLIYGRANLFLLDSNTNTWVGDSLVGLNAAGAPFTFQAGGVAPALTGTLTRVRVTSVNGTDTFNSGTRFQMFYEG